MADNDLPRTLAASSVSPPTDPWPPSGHTSVGTRPMVAVPNTGRRVPRWLVGVGAATAVLAVSAFLAVLLWPGGATTGPLEFRPFDPAGEIVLGDGVEGVHVRMDGDRIFLTARRDGSPVIAAADRSGQVAWETPIPELNRLASLTSMSGTVMVLGDAIAESPGDSPHLLLALDPDTGQERWRQGYHRNDRWHLAAGVATMADNETDRLRGLDPVSGDQLWHHPYPDGRAGVLSVLTEDDLAARSRLAGTPDTPRADGRLVVVGRDRSAEVIDTADGAVLDQAGNVADPNDEMLAYGDRLYVARADGGGYRLYSYDLTNLSAQPQVIYTAADARRVPMDGTLVPCGADRVCLLEQGDDQIEVVSLDVDGQGEAWRQTAADGAQRLLPIGDRLAVSASTPAVVIYDRDGTEVLDRPGVAVRLNGDNLLLFASEPGTGRTDLSVAGIAFGSGRAGSVDRIELGQLGSVRGAGCNWDEQQLVCPTATGAGIWGFTAS